MTEKERLKEAMIDCLFLKKDGNRWVRNIQFELRVNETDFDSDPVDACICALIDFKTRVDKYCVAQVLEVDEFTKFVKEEE